MATKFIQSPESALNHSIDWNQDFLQVGQTIQTSSWAAIPTGLTLSSGSESSGVTTIKVSGGVNGVEYTLRNTITTNDGFTDTRSVLISVWRPK